MSPIRRTGLGGGTNLGGPVHGRREHGCGQGVGQLCVDTALGRPLVDEGEKSASMGEWKGTYTGRYSHTGVSGAAAAALVNNAVSGSIAATRERQVVQGTRERRACQCRCAKQSAADAGGSRDSAMRQKRSGSDTPRTGTM